MKVVVDAHYVCHQNPEGLHGNVNLVDAACQVKVKCALQAVC